jgi:hypothetical protein
MRASGFKSLTQSVSATFLPSKENFVSPCSDALLPCGFWILSAPHWA